MRHQKHGRKFGRKSASRHALFSNMVSSLIEHERIQTTDAKAKELRRLVERTISWATSVGTLVGSDKADAADKARVVHAMRMAGRIVKHRPALDKLFNVVGPRFVGRPGGFTRIMKLRNRHGDAAPISIIELVDRTEATEAAQGEGKKADKPRAKAEVKADRADKKSKPAAAAAAAAAKPEKKPVAKKAEKKPASPSEKKPAKDK
jgi:large subunit ribosomal protein L17